MKYYETYIPRTALGYTKFHSNSSLSKIKGTKKELKHMLKELKNAPFHFTYIMEEPKSKENNNAS